MRPSDRLASSGGNAQNLFFGEAFQSSVLRNTKWNSFSPPPMKCLSLSCSCLGWGKPNHASLSCVPRPPSLQTIYATERLTSKLERNCFVYHPQRPGLEISWRSEYHHFSSLLRLHHSLPLHSILAAARPTTSYLSFKFTHQSRYF